MHVFFFWNFHYFFWFHPFKKSTSLLSFLMACLSVLCVCKNGLGPSANCYAVWWFKHINHIQLNLFILCAKESQRTKRIVDYFFLFLFYSFALINKITESLLRFLSQFFAFSAVGLLTIFLKNLPSLFFPILIEWRKRRKKKRQSKQPFDLKSLFIFEVSLKIVWCHYQFALKKKKLNDSNTRKRRITKKQIEK